MSAWQGEATHSDANAPPVNRQAGALVLLLVAATISLFPLLYYGLEWPAAIATAYTIPALLIVGLVLAVSIARAGSAPVSARLLLPGLVFIIGGAAFDMFATVLHSPDLSLERNPIARILLDSRHSVRFVYVYALVGQSLYACFIAVLWIGFLRHRQNILESTRDVPTFLQLVKAVSGGANLSWRQWCLPLRLSELPQAYPLLWMIAVILVAGSAYRWYLGLEWFGFFPGVGLWVGASAMVIGVGVYLLWLCRAKPISMP